MPDSSPFRGRECRLQLFQVRFPPNCLFNISTIMKERFDTLSATCSRETTRLYSTSFSLGILFFSKEIRQPIYAIYGFVRLADEIVDSFHEYPKSLMLAEFKKETFTAIERGIS